MKSVTTMPINNWVMKYRDYEDINCSVPCSVYSVLRDNLKIDDPLFGLNEQKYEDIPYYDVDFEAVFDVDSSLLSADFCNLVFEGIDTLAKVTVNGNEILNADNMHLKYQVNAKPYLKTGKNVINIHIFSPTKYMDEMEKEEHIYSMSYNYQGSAYLRKALYMGAWDWGPRILDMGIWRPVYIEAYNVAKFDFAEVRQNHNNGAVEVTVKPEIIGDMTDCTVKATLDDIEGVVCGDTIKFKVDNPKLWWTNCLGEPYLYTLKCCIVKDGNVLDTHTEKIGLRTITVSTEEDKWGREFCLKLNGEKIFAKGANYIPEKNILADLSYDKTRQLLEDCKEANFNCIRVWGGGYYPDDYFFDICDELGILVWQDFMFACCMVPDSQEFTENVTKEFIYNIKRIRNHASLALFCGNNECEEALRHWLPNPEQKTIDAYENMFHKVIPDICEKYAPDVFYWPSSPSTDGRSGTNSENEGDNHIWYQWLSGWDLDALVDKRYSRFCSEFGFGSFASAAAMKKGVSDEQFKLFTEEMDNHQKATHMSTGRILRYIGEKYGYLQSMEDIIYASQICQAEGIKYDVEHFRRNMGRCMGALYWQLNDVWPAVSWSSIDYLGIWKALHYYVKKSFAPVLMSSYTTENGIYVGVSNDTMESFNGEISVEVKDFNFNVLLKTCFSVNADRLSSDFKKDICINSELLQNKKNIFVLCTLYDEDKNIISQQTVVFVQPRYLKLRNSDIKYKLIKNGKEYKIILSSDTYMRNLMIDIDGKVNKFSDNYFDITSAEEIEISFVSSLSENEIIEGLTFKSEVDLIK